MPIVSIIIPVYNRESLIEKAVNSAINQSISDIEIIIVDNNSTDDTYKVCSRLAESDGRIRLYKNDMNIGPVKNWIKCVSYAQSLYSKILFSDDMIASNYLELTLPYILSKDCAFVYSPAIVGSEDWKGILHYQHFFTDCKIARDAYLRTSVHINNFTPNSPGAAIFRTADLNNNIMTELDGIEGYDFCANGAGVDWLTYVLTSLHYKYVAYVSTPLVFFHAHPDSISVKNENNLVPLGYSLAKKWFVSKINGL